MYYNEMKAYAKVVLGTLNYFEIQSRKPLGNITSFNAVDCLFSEYLLVTK